MDFEARYKTLNTAQKKAVDTIDGPVMVIAGPGTGKTELLSMRVANILKKTDTLPENILCLTFTESGAEEMRERLVSIIGQDGYKVAVHTFHSFGSEVINQNGEFFYQGAQFRPADELSSREILGDIFDELDYNNPLASKMNGDYTHLSDTLRAISELKKSGLTSSELLQILDANDETMDKLEKDLASVFSRRISPTTLSLVVPVAQRAAELTSPVLPLDIVPLGNILATSLAHAVDESQATDSTKPITAWKNKWLQKDMNGAFVFKDRKRQVKLRAVAALYDAYLVRMQEEELYDFDDMILQLVHTMETQPDLKYNLQEKYQYILVDEFQDTNLAQARILHNLTDNPVNEDKPNILVVGDDDQAIYAFQGADVSNILNFRHDYPATKLVVLTENYRSRPKILEAARGVITQGSDRLEHHLDELDKTLKSQQGTKGEVRVIELASAADERTWLVNDIASRLKKGTDPASIAVLTRRHNEIVALLPYFHDAKISVRYERQDNVLDSEVVQVLENLAVMVLALGAQRLDEANSLLPEILSHPAWNIPAETLWQLSLSAYTDRRLWLDFMLTMPELKPTAEWCISSAKLADHTPLERMLDHLMGYNAEKTGEFHSPYYEYYFSDTKKADNYLEYLEALQTIRQKFREYQPHQTPTLASFIQFIRLHRRENLPILRSRQQGADTAVNLMTAHKAKGLEFDSVYIVGATDRTWGETARIRSKLISYPENLPLTISGATVDERLRLFFVAMTRAKQHLTISYPQRDEAEKEVLPLGALLPLDIKPEQLTPGTTLGKKGLEDIRRQWYGHLVDPISPSMHEALAPFLERYKLSATHLNNFIDVTRGGPQHFLLANLLRFPSAMSPSAAYGSAIHSALQSAHAHLAAHGELKPLEDVLHDFEKALNTRYLSAEELEQYHVRGSDVLRVFLAARGPSFTPTQRVELSFASQQVMIGEARLTGNLDLVDIDQESKTIIVSDYKTGKAPLSWHGKTDYEKIKLHKYKQQLMFYKLLVEHSRDFSNYTVETARLEFVEPLPSGDIVLHDLLFDTDELTRFKALVEAIWKRIQTYDLPDTSAYDQSYKGVLAFEDDLLAGNA